MKTATLLWQLMCLFCFVVHNNTALAFSSPPEGDESYRPAVWSSSTSAKNDAMDAVKNDDLRLLGFAGRGGSLPGVDNSQKQNYIESCGIRYFDEFGDLIREREQLDQMKKARQYATEYNRIILMKCPLKDTEKALKNN